jgi:hypothetical protein
MAQATSKNLDRRHFIGGSGARIIMGQDEKALTRHLSANLHRPARAVRLRSLTPGPPPFSSMNTMPALTRAASIFSPVSARPPKGPSFASSRLIVGTDTFAAEANCS